MKKNTATIIHAVIVAVAAVLIAVSSYMAYPLGDLNIVLGMAIGCVALDVVLMLLKKGGVIRDLLMLASVALAALCLCRILIGRADLMGYIWFSDLEAGNPVAVASLNLATGAMSCFLIAAIMNIVSGFRKSK